MEDIGNVDESVYLNSLALFYLKLQAKLLLPGSTIQNIIEEFQDVHDIGMSYLFGRLGDKIRSPDFGEEEIRGLNNDLSKNDLLSLCNKGPLRIDKTRTN